MIVQHDDLADGAGILELQDGLLLDTEDESGVVHCAQIRSSQILDAFVTRTEDIHLLQLGRNTVKEGRDLLLVCDVELDSGELAACLDARFLVCSSACLGDSLQLVCPSRSEDDVRASLRDAS